MEANFCAAKMTRRKVFARGTGEFFGEVGMPRARLTSSPPQLSRGAIFLIVFLPVIISIEPN